MVKLNTYSLSGIKTNSNLPKVFQEKINLDLLAQAVRVYKDKNHPGLSRVKTRGEVNLTKAKVWRQKGTGRARHGARSAPIFVGGGVAHGPKGVKKSLTMSRKMARKALIVALSFKANKAEVVTVNNLSKIKKTKEAQKLINQIISKENLKKEAKISVIFGTGDLQKRLAFRNLKNVQILNFENLNTLDVFQGGLLIFDKEAIDAFTKSKVTLSDKVEKKVQVKDVKTGNVVKKKRTVKVKPGKGTK
jgi:large subunit ribosomal protein L4